MTNHLSWINNVKPSVDSRTQPKEHGPKKIKEKLRKDRVSKDKFIKDIAV